MFEARREATKSTKPLKNIDDIKSFREMLALFELLGLPFDPENLNLAQLKKEAKAKIEEQSSARAQHSNATTGFIISKAKERDMLIRRELKKTYSEVDDCLAKFDEDVFSIVNSYNEDYDILKIHNEQKERLEKHDYLLLLTGESSAGKSTLLNLILGEELLPRDVLHATSTICEIKYGGKKLVAHYKPERNLPPNAISLETNDKCDKKYKDRIAEYMFLGQDHRQKGSEYQKVELFWPSELLQEGVVIIDTPGVDESDEMNEVLMNYLPQAFAFIHVIDVSHAGGLQDDHKKMLKKILANMRSRGTEHLAKCSLFVGNKWDLIEKEDRDKVKKYVATALSECWQDASHQVVYISAQQSIQLQQYGGVTTEFQELLQNIKQMILRAIDARLYDHWRWLDFVLSQIVKLTDFFTNEIKSNVDERRERGNSLESRIHDIEIKKATLNKDIMERIDRDTNDFLRILGKYIDSSEFQLKFCSWSDSSVPQKGDTWSITKAKIQTAIEDRLQDFLKQWDSETQYHEKHQRKLIDEFLARFNLLEEEIEGGADTTHSVAKQVKYLNNRSQMSTKEKILVEAASPLWIPAGIAGFVIGMPAIAALTLKRKLSEKMKLDVYEENPREYLEKQSKKFLAARAEVERVVTKYVTEQMTKTSKILSIYFEMISRLIEADKKMVSQLRKIKARYFDKVWQHVRYNTMRKKSLQIRKDMLSLGIEVYPATVDACELEWKEDFDSCIGGGEFSLVYSGKLKNSGTDSIKVAVKVFKKPFDELNSKFYLNEETKIKSLHHENVLKFYGAIKLKVSPTSNDYKFAFVMKYCQGNLEDIIFQGEVLTPGQTKNHKEVKLFLKWAGEIVDGLNYIHNSGLVHRHLKLKNILVDTWNKAMIGDTGIVGTFAELEKSIIYLAPEVLEDRRNCTKAADIYSCGIMMWEMWYGVQAFTELQRLDKATFQKKVANGYRPRPYDMMISYPEPHMIMTSCWVSNPHERPSANECTEKLCNMQQRLKHHEESSKEGWKKMQPPIYKINEDRHKTGFEPEIQRHHEEENFEITAEVKLLQNKNTNVTTRSQCLEQENNQNKVENTDLKTINNLLQEDSSSLELRWNQQQQRVSSSRSRYNQLRNIRKNNEIQNHVDDKRKKDNGIRQLHEEKDLIEKEKQQLLEAKNSMESQIQQLREENIRMNNQNKKHVDDNRKKDNGIRQLQLQRDQIQKEKQQLQEAKNSMESQIQQLREENIKKSNETQQRVNDIRKKDHDISELNQQKHRIEKVYQQLQEEKSSMESQMCIQIQQLGKEKNDMEQENQQLRQANREKDNVIHAHEESIRNLSNDIQQLQEQNDGMRNELQSLRQENDNMETEINRLHKNTGLITECGTVTFSTDELLGKGGWAAVYTGDFYGTKVAVKEYYEVILSPHNRQILEREINIASQCRHPNLLQMICATENEKKCLVIVTELMDMALRTLLEQRANENLRLDPSQVKLISLDVARGLNYLHLQKPDPIIHRDVSSANVLLWMENGSVRRAKISDYGSANFMQACNTANPGAALYAAPEARRAEQTPKIDVFSYGLLVCEMCNCELPDQVGRRHQIKKITNTNCRGLVEACTRVDPERRPAMADLLEFWKSV